MKIRSRFYKILFVSLLLSALLITGQVFAAPTTQSTATAVIDTGALNVRSGPAPTYSRVTTVYLNDVVTLLGRVPDSSWVQIQTASGHQGWINSRYILPYVELSTLPIVSTPITPGNAPGGNVTAGNLNVRSGPGPSYPPVTVVTYGEFVALTGRNYNGSWVRIRTNAGHEGWVNGSYLTTNASISDLPIVDSPEATTPVATVIATYLNVRSGPSVDYGWVATLNYGDRVALLSRNADGSWVQIQNAVGQQGWVNGAYLVADVPVGSLPQGGVPENPIERPSGPMATITANYLNVRGGAGLQHAVISVVTYGEVVNLLGRDMYSTWVKVQTPTGVVGWINSDYTQPNVAISTLPVADTGARGSATVIANYLNVRQGPSMDSAVILALSYGQNMSLIGRSSDGYWLKVQTANGTVGWVSGAYVQSTTDTSQLPIAN